MKRTTRFKHYLLAKEILMIPVAHDPLCATIIQRAGFKVVGCGGGGNFSGLFRGPAIKGVALSELGGVPMQWICRFLGAVTMATEIQPMSEGPSSSLKKLARRR